MRILPKTSREAIELIWDILEQGDSRYKEAEAERILAFFFLIKRFY